MAQCKSYPCSAAIGSAGGNIEVLAEHSKFVAPASALSSTYTFTLQKYAAPSVTGRTVISTVRAVAYSPTSPVPDFARGYDASIVFYDLSLPGSGYTVEVYSSSDREAPIVGPGGWQPIPSSISRGVVTGTFGDLSKKYFLVMYY